MSLLKHFDLAAMGLLSADAVHVTVEAKKFAFADRVRRAADPRSLGAPLAELLFVEGRCIVERLRHTGADNQIQVNLQVLTAMIDFGLDPQQPAEMPRWTSNVPGQHANWPHDGEDALTIERRFPEEMRRELARRGHPLKPAGDLEGPCSVEIIRRDGATGMLLAGSDRRRDGWALAW